MWKTLALIVGLLFVIFLADIGIRIYKYSVTVNTAKKLAAIPHDDVESGSLLSETDAYGNQLMFKRQASSDAITQYVISAGRDGEWHTSDDIVSEKTDFNKSRIAGKWVGQKSKEFIKGFMSPSSRFKD